VVIVVPDEVMDVVSNTSTIGFSGSRSPSFASVKRVKAIATMIPDSVSVVVGCQRGIDAVVRELFEDAQVFKASDYGSGKGSYAARSVACVRTVAAAGVWCSFPKSVCPDGLFPSSSSGRCFCGLGSGSWASLAFALGLGVRCVVFLPNGVDCPSNWGLVSVGGGWFVPELNLMQLSLF
jgi:hypothetical protein